METKLSSYYSHVFNLRKGNKLTQTQVSIATLILAGYTGRDPKMVEQHISELEAIGISRPSATPSFYWTPKRLLTTANRIKVKGEHTSGEVEPVLIYLPDGWYLGVGSDHTDRELETQNITLSKQVCPKVIGSELWHIDSVIDHWDKLILRSYLINNSEQYLYQESALSAIQKPEYILERYIEQGKNLPEGFTIFLGTVPVIGKVMGAEGFAIKLFDPILNQTIKHQYHVEMGVLQSC